MKLETMEKAMKTSIFEVLETMFYMAPEFADLSDHPPESGDTAGSMLGCTLEFSNGLSGRFTALAPPDFLREMTENFMALDPDEITSTHMEGIIKEYLNMVAGGTFRLYDDTLVFNLGTPAIIPPDEAAAAIDNAGDAPLILARTDSGVMWITIEM
ncbi:MAG: hypothetical protein SWH68_02640 [Thermodesulfobacteriota bacterium]|nr:hypothetical protein [Thermodesulfobacteriota bacterium]